MEYLQTQFSHFFSSSWNPSCHPFQHQHIQMLLPIFFCRWIWGVILIWLLLNVVYCTRDESKETFGAFYPWFGRGGTAPRLSSLLLLQLKIPLHPIIQWPPIPIHTWTDLNPEAVSRAPPDPILSKYHPSQGAALFIHLLPSLGCDFLWIN